MSLYRLALERIRDGSEPCRQCGEPHPFHAFKEVRNGEYVVSRGAGTWAALDGHPYQRLTPSDYARKVLSS